MKRFLRAGYGTACLLLMTFHAAPSLAADAVVVAQPRALLSFTSQSALGDALQGPVTPAPLQLQSAAIIAPLHTLLPAPVRGDVLPPAPVPLRDLVISFIDRRDQDAEQTCLANAVYFEARSEPLEGQLAVAQVVLNRAASGTFPAGVCAVVLQPAQFSFVRRGTMPSPDKGSACWHRALAIADIARKRTLAGQIASNVLWYHATYVSPAWGRQRTRFAQIGKHVFFS